MKNTTHYTIGALRLSLGFIFLWAFLDKTFGLGFATPVEKSWIAGGSPTTGYLTHATKGPFAEIFQSMAGSPLVDVLFMTGLLFVGLTLILGVLVRLGSIAGIAMLILMYVAGEILPENNPVFSYHIIYALIMILFINTNAGRYFGFGDRWSRNSVVRKTPFLK